MRPSHKEGDCGTLTYKRARKRARGSKHVQLPAEREAMPVKEEAGTGMGVHEQPMWGAWSAANGGKAVALRIEEDGLPPD